MTNTSNKKKKKRGVSIKACIVMLAVVMLLGCAIGSTVAWLTAKTDEVKNTFTYGNIDIDLKEHKYDPETYTLSETEYLGSNEQNNYKIIPGVDLPKDPKVIVKAGSEKCWLFVKVERTGSFATSVTYALTLTEENGWKSGDGNTIPANVYYKEVDVSEASNNLEIQLIERDTITVSKNLTKSDIDNLKTTTDYSNPELKFTAYAIQRASFDTAEAAWTEASKTTTP